MRVNLYRVTRDYNVVDMFCCSWLGSCPFHDVLIRILSSLAYPQDLKCGTQRVRVNVYRVARDYNIVNKFGCSRLGFFLHFTTFSLRFYLYSHTSSPSTFSSWKAMTYSPITLLPFSTVLAQRGAGGLFHFLAAEKHPGKGKGEGRGRGRERGSGEL